MKHEISDIHWKKQNKKNHKNDFDFDNMKIIIEKFRF